jgi:Xaa-Pro aminopeptidase
MSSAGAATLGKMQQRLQRFRELLKAKKPAIGAYVIPHNDAHFSEYICPRDERIAYISGFDGSAGCCVITQKEALLWTDGRYFNQCQHQLSDDWTLMKQGEKDVPSI